MATKAKLPSSPRGRGRLLRLANVLENDAKRKTGIKFDLDVVCKPSSGPLTKKKLKLDCGTTACAIGLWGIHPSFRKDGVSAQACIDTGEMWPTYRGRSGREAAEAYFKITGCESHWLFIASQYDGPTKGARGEIAVAARIRDFVAGKAAPERQLAW